MMNRNMMKQAQQLQKQMLKAQQEIEETKVAFSSGGGVVKVVVSGKMVVESIEIDPDAVPFERELTAIAAEPDWNKFWQE